MRAPRRPWAAPPGPSSRRGASRRARRSTTTRCGPRTAAGRRDRREPAPADRTGTFGRLLHLPWGRRPPFGGRSSAPESRTWVRGLSRGPETRHPHPRRTRRKARPSPPAVRVPRTLEGRLRRRSIIDSKFDSVILLNTTQARQRHIEVAPAATFSGSQTVTLQYVRDGARRPSPEDFRVTFLGPRENLFRGRTTFFFNSVR